MPTFYKYYGKLKYSKVQANLTSQIIKFDLPQGTQTCFWEKNYDSNLSIPVIFVSRVKLQVLNVMADGLWGLFLTANMFSDEYLIVDK